MHTQHDPSTFARNMAKVTEQCQLILQEFLSKQVTAGGMGSNDPMHLSHAFMEFFAHSLANPSRLLETQMGLWQDYVHLWQSTTQRFLGDDAKPVIEPDGKDRRFKDSAWQESILFDFIKQSYLLSARWIHHSVNEVDGLDQHTARKVDFYTRQFVDAMARSNFLMTNPEVLRTTIESNGQNLVNGMQQMLEDLSRSNGTLRISMTDQKAFELGKNLAVTPGKVVYENDLMQLIQYAPTTKQVCQTPLLIIPAWINKYYILDLQPQNSMVKWLVDHGHTVFVISWVNPNAKLGRKTFDDYLEEGPLSALDTIADITGEAEVNLIGYCLGGTLLSVMLAWLHAKRRKTRVKSATYLTTMIDFAEAGELSVFIDEEQLSELESRMSEKGYLDGSDMAATFNMLRANDLIWSFVINNYLLGKDPFPFDLLYWNSDSTRMPAVMHSFYLRNMYQKNMLVKKNALKIGGVPIDLSCIETPTYILATREDHIAPWKSTYAATQIYKGPVRFVLAASGHIAGVINPPISGKYSYWTAEGKHPQNPDKWFGEAKENAGSWWPDWQDWVGKYSGKKIPARKLNAGKHIIEDAPGRYARVKT